MSKCLADLLDSIGSFLTLLRFLSFVGSQCFDREKLVEVLNLGFDWCRPLGQGSRDNWCEARRVEVSKCRNCRPRSLKFTRLSCRASKLATAWALESQVWAAKNHWTNFRFEFFKIFLFVRSEILLVLLYRIQWHAIARFFTRIFLAALRWCGEDVEGGTSVWFCGLCATTATCFGGGPKLTLHTENHLVCCVGTTFIGDIRQDFNHLYSPSIPHAFIHFSIWSWFR